MRSPLLARAARTPGARRTLALLAALLVLTLLGAASAHATLVFGRLTLQPDPPAPGEPFTLQLVMTDPVRTPVASAFVLAQFTQVDGDEASTVRLLEVSEGTYRAEVRLAEPGAYHLTMRDQTYPQEDAVAELDFEVGGDEPLEELLFVFPPTDTGTATLSTWLIWLVAVPVGAGLVITLLVLAGGKRSGGEGGESERRTEVPADPPGAE